MVSRRAIGDTSAASTSFQVASVLARGGALDGGLGLVTAIDRDGTVGCVLLRRALMTLTTTITVAPDEARVRRALPGIPDPAWVVPAANT